MPFQPGHPKLGGRQKGTRDKRNQARIDLVKSMAELPPEIKDIKPLEAMLIVMRWSLQDGDRHMLLAAAAAAAPYMHAKLASTELRISNADENLSDEELARQIAELERQIADAKKLPN